MHRTPAIFFVVAFFTFFTSISTLSAASKPYVTSTYTTFELRNDTADPARSLLLRLSPTTSSVIRGTAGENTWGLAPSVGLLRDDLSLLWRETQRLLSGNESRRFGFAAPRQSPPVTNALVSWEALEASITFPWPGNWSEIGTTGRLDLHPTSPSDVLTVDPEVAFVRPPLPLSDLKWDSLNVLPWHKAWPERRELSLADGAQRIEVPIPPAFGGKRHGFLIRVESEDPDGVGTVKLICQAVFNESGERCDISFTFEVENRTGAELSAFWAEFWQLAPDRILEWYQGEGAWGAPPLFRSGGLDGFVTWSDPSAPWENSRTHRFGLRVNVEDTQQGSARYFYFMRRKVLPFLFPGWSIERRMNNYGAVVDSSLDPRAPSPVLYTLQYAVLSQEIPLAELPAPPHVEWEPKEPSVLRLEPGGNNRMKISLGNGTGVGAVLLRYRAWPEGNETEEIMITAEAVLETGVTIRETRLTWEALPGPDVPGGIGVFTGLQALLPGMRRDSFTEWYMGPKGWGCGPALFGFGRPVADPSVQECIWISESNPLPPDAERTFRLETSETASTSGRPLDASAFLSTPRAPVAVPWTRWSHSPGGTTATVHYEGGRESVWIQRWTAASPQEIPLNDLTWENGLAWTLVEKFPVELLPGHSLDRSFPAADGVYLLRYEINEARLSKFPVARCVHEVMVTGGRISTVHTSVQVRNGGAAAPGFTLLLAGIDPSDIAALYEGDRAWGDPGRASTVENGTAISYLDLQAPVQSGLWASFGLTFHSAALARGGPTAVTGEWTDLEPRAFPWLSWDRDTQRMISMVKLGENAPSAVNLTLEYALRRAPVALPLLGWNVAGVSWLSLGHVTLNPGEEHSFPIDIEDDTAAVIVRCRSHTAGRRDILLTAEAVILPNLQIRSWPVVDLTAEALTCHAVRLRWIAPEKYAFVKILRDGEEIAVLSDNVGAEETGRFQDSSASPGAHTYCVIGIRTDRESPPTCVDITIPDCPPGTFVRGDANKDTRLDIADAIHTLSVLFAGASTDCRDALDFNDDGAMDIADPIYGLSYLFASGPPPPAPFPTAGTDPTPDSLDCERTGK